MKQEWKKFYNPYHSGCDHGDADSVDDSAKDVMKVLERLVSRVFYIPKKCFSKRKEYEYMIQLNKDDLLEVQMDLNGISNMLVVIESSEYYTAEDKSVFRTVRNSIDFTKNKLDNLIVNT